MTYQFLTLAGGVFRKAKLSLDLKVQKLNVHLLTVQRGASHHG